MPIGVPLYYKKSVSNFRRYECSYSHHAGAFELFQPSLFHEFELNEKIRGRKSSKWPSGEWSFLLVLLPPSEKLLISSLVIKVTFQKGVRKGALKTKECPLKL